MKEATRELIEWIKESLPTGFPNYRQEAIYFLDSFPEIESRLCKGGYIQDDKGTPCCDGDMVRFITNSDYKGYGYLKWNRNEKRFLIEEIVDKDATRCDFIMSGLKQFIKVNPGLKMKEGE